MRDEFSRRQSNTENVLALLRANPGRWLHWRRFFHIAGECAWRSRISDARKVIRSEGGVLENNKRVTRSAYRYLPYVPLARDAGVPVRNWPTKQRELF